MPLTSQLDWSITSNMTETEAKFTITIDEYYDIALSRAFAYVGRSRQLNVYYDTEFGDLAAAGATCRVRFEDDFPPILTLKTGLWLRGARVAEEVEMLAATAFGRRTPRSSLYVSDLSVDIQELLPGVNQLLRMGWMRTDRCTYTTGPSTFELDAVELPGGVSFCEVEVEESNPDIRQATVRAILAVVPGAVPSTFSKYQRFTQAVKALKGSP